MLKTHPMTIFDCLSDELAMSERILRSGKQLVPRFRIFSPEGQYIIVVPLSGDHRERDRRMRLIAGFMAWKMAVGFMLSAELETPDAITSFVVTRSACSGVMRRIRRGDTLSFGVTEELDAHNAGSDLLAMLPKRESAITGEQVRELERVFDEDDGEMPARRVS